MAIFKTTIDYEKRLYVPKEIREMFGTPNVELISIFRAAVIYGRGTSYEDVIRSLELIIADLKLMAEKRKVKAH